MAVQDIRAKLSLDDAEFSAKLSANEKNVLKFSAAVGAITAAATAAAVATADWQDKTGKLAQSAGVSASSFSKLAVAAEKSNVSQEDLANTLAKISAASPEMVTRISQVGVSFRNASGQAKTSSEVFADVADKVAKAGSTADKTAIAVRAFGEEGAKLVPLLSGGRAELQKLAAEADKYGLVVSEQAAAAAAEFNDKLAETKNALKGTMSAIGESVIAWSNQAGIMDTVRDKLAEATQWWRGLSDTTKNTIITIGAAAAAFATLLTVVIAIKAALPAVVGALGTIFSPVGLIVAAVIGLSVALGTLKTSTQAAADAAKKQEEIARKNITALAQQETTLQRLNGLTKLSSTDEAELAKIKIDLAQRAKNAGLALDAQAASAADLLRINKQLKEIEQRKEQEALTKQFVALAVEYNRAEKKVSQYTRSVERLNAANRSDLAEISAKQLDQATGAREKYRKELDALALKIEAVGKVEAKALETVNRLRTPAAEVKPPEILYKNELLAAIQEQEMALLRLKAARAPDKAAQQDAIKDIETLTETHRKEQAAATSAAAQSGIAYAKYAQTLVNSITPAISAISSVTDAMAGATRYAAKVAARDLEVTTIRAQRAYEAQKTALEEQNAAAVESITTTYDAKISAVTNGEAAITAAIEFERNKRLLADDAEYQAAVEALRLQFEAKKALIDQNSLDIEQRRLNDAVAEQSFQQQLANLATQFANKKNETNKAADEKAKANKAVADNNIKKLEADKNAALEAEKKRADAALKALDEKKAAEDKALEKQKLQVQYDAELQEFEQTKAVKSVQTTASGIAAAASAFAATAGALPFGLGIPIGIAIAATILGATAASVSQINSQKPVKPAALIAADGGTIMGGEYHTGASGGVDIKAERGETILSRELTSKLDASLSGREMNGAQNIYFEPGAIQLLELTPDIVTAMARAVGDEIRRGGLALA